MSDALFILDFVADAVWNVWPAFLLSVFLGVMVRALKLDGAIRRAFSTRVGIAIVLATLSCLLPDPQVSFGVYTNPGGNG